MPSAPSKYAPKGKEEDGLWNTRNDVAPPLHSKHSKHSTALGTTPCRRRRAARAGFSDAALVGRSGITRCLVAAVFVLMLRLLWVVLWVVLVLVDGVHWGEGTASHRDRMSGCCAGSMHPAQSSEKTIIAA
ncbi:hypothetical protein EDC01DRAFT_777823 [Geopyxis carbonaria]|nr:hypothetical protein EDC01DRAFT_777823 [Geopyxis carbonaria]